MYTHKNGITLKKADQYDLDVLLALKQESWFGTHHIAIINSSDQQKWFEKITSDPKNIVMIAWQDVNTQNPHAARKIGVYKISNIDWINRRYDSAHDVFAEHRGKGFSTPILEAGVDFGFEVLNMHRLDTEVLENNIASYKSALRVGFEREGVKRKAVHKCGQYLDSIFMGIVREDWEQLERVKKYNGCCNVSYTPKDGH